MRGGGEVRGADLQRHRPGGPSSGVRDVAGCRELLRVGRQAAADRGGVGEGGAGDGRAEVPVGERGVAGTADFATTTGRNYNNNA